MATQAPVRAGQQPVTAQTQAQAQVAEHEAWSTRGIKVLVTGVVGVLVAVWVLWYSAGRPVTPRPCWSGRALSC